MILKKWEDLPSNLRIDEVKPYYDLLAKKKIPLFIKRLFDIVVSFIMIIILCPFFFIVAIVIKIDSKGPVFYRQERITQYGRVFKIFKFRSMIQDADKGNLITSSNDSRITRVGKFIRNSKIDELPQLFNVFIGDMSFVGTRPEVKKYVDKYTNEMKATLLLPAGITNMASIYYCGESELIKDVENVDQIYISKILPDKMKWNLEGLREFSVFNDIKIMFLTIFTILRKENN